MKPGRLVLVFALAIVAAGTAVVLGETPVDRPAFIDRLEYPLDYGNLVRTHSAPITPTLVVPLPSRYRIVFGEPIRLCGPLTTASVAAGVGIVRETLERMIAEGLAARRHVFF